MVMRNLSDALVERVEFGLGCNYVYFLFVGYMLVAYLSMRLVPIKMLTDNFFTVLNFSLMISAQGRMKMLT